MILTWVPRPPDGLRPLIDVVNALTQPVFRALRPMLPPLRIGNVALDLSAIVIFVLIGLIQRQLC